MKVPVALRNRWPALAVTLALCCCAASAQVTATASYRIRVERDVPFAVGASHAEADGYRDLHLDVYRPRKEGAGRPAVVILHGGAFTFLDKAQKHHRRLGKYFARRGFVAFSIDYRQVADAPPAPSGYTGTALEAAQYAATMDAKAAVRWIRANHAAYGIDPNRVAAVGSSAGATTVYGLALTDSTDFAVDAADDPAYLINHPEQSARVQAAVALWGNPGFYMEEADAADPPLLIVHSRHDPHRKETPFEAVARLVDALDAAGAPYRLHALDVPGHTHWGASVAGKPVFELVFTFCARQLGVR